MLWLKPQLKTLVGIDVSTRYLKLVELEHSQEGVKFLHYAIGTLPITVLSEGNEIKNSATVSTTLLQLREEANIRSSKAAVAMPGSSVVTKRILISKGLGELAMESQVWLEAAKHFPELVEDLSLDFHIEGESPIESEQLDVLLVACRKTSIQKLANILQDSHFDAEVVDVDYYALERALNYILARQPEYDPTQAYAIFNFGTHSTSLVVVRDQQLLYGHDQVFDGQRLLQKVQQELRWGDFILDPSELDPNIDTAIMQNLTEAITSHVHYSLELFYSSVNNVNLRKLFISGDCAIIPKLAELISARSNIETAIVNPFVSFPLEEKHAKLQTLGPALTLAFGLALHQGKE